MEPLFCKYDLNQTLANKTQRLREHVNKLDQDYLLGASEDDLTAYLVQEFSMDPIVLGEPFVADSSEIDIDVSRDPLRRNPFGGRSIAKGMEIHIKVPYTGDGNLFWFQPSHFTFSPPRGVVTNDYLEFIIRGERLVGENVKQDLDSTLREIRGYLDDIASTCNAYNASLDEKIREMLRIRKERLLSNRGILANLGLPIQTRADAPRTFAVPDVQRKPKMTAPVVTEKTFVPEPALEAKEYENILSIIRSMVSVMEKSPGAFAHMGEEDLRTHFLVQLNGQYQGRATGETFNYQGKTDILIREGDRNVFIAECKIWKGEADLLKGLDQILAYLHWRDTKAALLVFNRNKGFSDVLSKIAAAIQRHPNCKKLLGTQGETEWRFLFSSKDDANRELQLAVVAFDVPKSAPMTATAKPPKPDSWRWRTIGETGRYINGVAFKPGDWVGEGLPIIRIQNLTDRAKPLNRTRRKVDDIYRVEPGELLVSWSATLDAFIWDREPALLNQHIFKVVPDTSIVTKRFLFYLLRLAIADMMKSEHLHGSTMKHINRGPFLAHRVPVPSLPEQDIIVAEIEKQFTRLEAGVAALRRVQVNLKRYRAAVLKAACEGRLVPTEAELAKAENRKFETGEELLARMLTERRKLHERAQAASTRKKKYKEPILPNIPANEEFPEGWTWASWDQIGLSQNGRPFRSAEYQALGFKLLRPGNLHISGKVIWNEGNTRCMPQKRAEENPDLIVHGGELVMNLTAQSLKDEFLGRVCLTSAGEECLLNQRLARLTPLIVSPHFVLYLLKAWRFRRFVDRLNSGSLIQHMFTSQLAEFIFPLPPLAEQTRIVSEVERRLSAVEQLESVLSASLQRATRLRQSILQKAFTGKLIV